jgi:hypothetical protein
MLLESPGTVGVGEELELEFAIPQVPEPLRPRAKVVRKEPLDRIGVRFITLTAEAREIIRRYVSAGVKAQHEASFAGVRVLGKETPVT